MKKSFVGILISLFLWVACTPKNQFTIQGTLDNVKDSTMVFLKLNDEEGYKNVDSCFIINKTFTLKGKIDQVKVAYLTIPEFRFNQPIFVEPNSTTSISGTLEKMDIVGSVSQNEFNDYENLLSELYTKQQGVYNRYFQTPREDTAKLRAIEIEYDVLDSMIQEARISWIHQHSNSYVSPYIIMKEMVYSATAEELKSNYEMFSEPIQTSYYGMEMKKRIEVLTLVSEGQPAPEIALPNKDGDTMRLSDLKGQYVLIDFWASWCRPCRNENPFVVAAYTKYHEQGFTVYGISLDDNRDKWLKAIEDDGLIWNTHVSSLKGWENEFAKKYGVMSIPSNFLIDKEGVIVGKDLRGKDLEAKLAEIFPETI